MQMRIYVLKKTRTVCFDCRETAVEASFMRASQIPNKIQTKRSIELDIHVCNGKG